MAEQENKQKNDNPQEQEKRGRGTWDIRPYLAVGLTAIIVIFIALAIFFFFFRFNGFSTGVGNIISSLYGIIIGLILGYLLNPVMRFFERLLKKKMFTKAGTRTQRQNRTIRAIAVVIAMACFLTVVVILLVLIVPQLVNSVTELVTSMDEKLDTLVDWVNRLMPNTEIAARIDAIAQDAFKWVGNWLETNILDTGEGNAVGTLTAGVYSALRILISIIVGIIVAIYVLMTKERFVGQGKKLIYAIFKPKAGNVVVAFFHRANEVFGGFFVGKIIDSLIVGFICLAFMSILHFPYIALISVIIGITNIIPVFGPFIGAIPSVILIFLVNPIYALYFVIFIIVLQQVDGNIIGPKILGNTTGLSPFWIIFAILLFGGAFGIVGMIFGVPVFAMIYYIIKRVAEFVLKRNDLPEDTMDYTEVESIDPNSHEITYRGTDGTSYRKAFQNLNRRRNRRDGDEEHTSAKTGEEPEDEKTK